MQQLRTAFCLLACTLAAHSGQLPDRPGGPAQGCEPAGFVKADAKSPADLSGALPVADYLDSLFACTDTQFPGFERLMKPRNDWLQKDSQQYSELLGKNKFSWLIVPAQNQYFGFDRIERALLSAEIADAFAGQGNAPSTLLVARALGEVRRRYEPGAAMLLASKVQATRVLEIFAGHDGKRRMALTLRLWNCQPKSACTLSKQHDWRNVAFSDVQPPFVVVRAMRDAMVREMVGAKGVAATQAPVSTSQSSPNLSRLGAAEITAEPALISGVIASLAPSQDSLGRERLQVIALRDALAAVPSSANRVRAAHAAYRLYRRPYALKLIEGLNDPAAVTMRHLLNANLPEAQQSLKQIDVQDLKLNMSFDVKDLGTSYWRDVEYDGTAAAIILGKEPGPWSMAANRRASDLDYFASNVSMVQKLMLDRVAPIAGRDLQTTIRGQQAVGRDFASDDPLAMPALRHMKDSLPNLPAAECCSVGNSNARWPIYWLAESLIVSDMLKKIASQSMTQSRPEAAKNIIDQYDTYYAGHPDFEVLRSSTLSQLADRASEEAAELLRDRADAAELSAAYWSQGQNSAAMGSAMRGGDTRVPRAAYSRDFPMRGAWLPMEIGPESGDSMCESLNYSTVEIQSVEFCLASLPVDKQAVLRKELAGRFHGSSLKSAVPMNVNAAAPVVAGDEISNLRATIAADPEPWSNYTKLGLLLLRQADYAGAQKAYLSYPGFRKKPPSRPVELSNIAYEMGSELYWRGQYELARPLYKIAADLDTGSHASMTSEIRLQMLDNEFEAATQGSLDRAMRYPNPYAFRDYLSFLHVFGLRDDAQAGFQQVSDEFENAAAWMALLVGQRMQSMSAEQFKTWILSDEIRKSHHNGLRYAPIYTLWWMTTDRKPTKDLLPIMQRLEQGVRLPVESDGITFGRYLPERPGISELIRPSPFSGGSSPRMAPDSNAPSEYLLLTDALVPFYSGDYVSSVGKFVSFAQRYPIEDQDTVVALSYFAYAAAKTGDKVGLERYLSRIPDVESNYDAWLARAYFAAVRQDADSAVKALVRAVNVRPHTDSRPIITEYQFVEACEIVLRETGDKRLPPMIIDWARRFQRVNPVNAWAYAVEAQYSKNPIDVNRALAMTLYLDPASPRIAKFDAAKLAAARAWLKAHNPFLVSRPGATKVSPGT